MDGWLVAPGDAKDTAGLLLDPNTDAEAACVIVSFHPSQHSQNLNGNYEKASETKMARGAWKDAGVGCRSSVRYTH